MMWVGIITVESIIHVIVYWTYIDIHVVKKIQIKFQISKLNLQVLILHAINSYIPSPKRVPFSAVRGEICYIPPDHSLRRIEPPSISKRFIA